jgi:hypothetical protein
MYVIEVWVYEWEKYLDLIFRFRGFWSKVVKVSKHKRVNYKRHFYATPLEKIRDDQKILSPTRRSHVLVEKKRLEDKGCL